MEENIRESDFDVTDKNQKISIIKSSHHLTHRINEQNNYLLSKKLELYNNNSNYNLLDDRLNIEN